MILLSVTHAEKLAAAIKASPLRQAGVARKLGVTEATVSRWAAGKQSVKPENWEGIREMFGIDFSQPDERPAAGMAELHALLLQLGADVQSLRDEVAELRTEVRAPAGPSRARRPARRPAPTS